MLLKKWFLAFEKLLFYLRKMSEIIFEVCPDEIDGGFIATALGYDIFTQGETVEELRQRVNEAVRCHFFDFPQQERPRIIRLHFVHDEVLVA